MCAWAERVLAMACILTFALLALDGPSRPERIATRAATRRDAPPRAVTRRPPRAAARRHAPPRAVSVCLSVWAVRDVSTPWPTEEGVRRLLLIVAAGRLLSRGWLGGCE